MRRHLLRENPFLNLLEDWFVYQNRTMILTRDRALHDPRRIDSMNGKLKTTLSFSLALLVASLMSAPTLGAQAANRYLGTITAITGTTLTVKTDAGEVHQVLVPADASIKQVAPGQKDLSSAQTIQFTDLASGDRVLVRLDPNSTGDPPQALQVIAIKQADVAAKQQKDREDWQRRGVGGLVKSVDAGSGVIVLTSGAGATAKTVTVQTTKATVLRRYAPTSVRFDDAQPAPIDAIHAGDQLRARGTKNADGTTLAAEEVVSGSFRNISGVVVSVDAASSTLVIKDLATKKPVTVHVTADVQMRRLPDRMAQMLAARLKGSSGSGQGSGFGQGSGAQQAGASGGPTRTGQGQGTGGGQGSGQGGGAGQGAGGGQFPGGGQGGGQGGGDLQQMLSRAPSIQLSDLLKGEAVMIVSTEGASEVTAVSLLAGVEPLLQAPEASQNLLANWSMGGGGAEAAGAQ
jgi:hypothetical protein